MSRHEVDGLRRDHFGGHRQIPLVRIVSRLIPSHRSMVRKAPAENTSAGVFRVMASSKATAAPRGADACHGLSAINECDAAASEADNR
jgi:hypothetical protein